MSSPYTEVYWNEEFPDYPIQVNVSDPFTYRFNFAVDVAEQLANQILAACQDYREEKKEKK